MKKLVIFSVAALSLLNANAQKIDFNLSGKESQSIEVGYTGWSVGRVTNAQNSFAVTDSTKITVKAESVPGMAGNAVYANWWKDGVNKYSKLVSDGLYSIILDSQNNYTFSATNQMGLQFTITGLTPGEHTLCAYHNNTDGYDTPNLKVVVNGEVLQEGVAQTNRKQATSLAGMSYVKFKVEEGKSVIVQYISEPVDGVKYGNMSVVVNSLVFDRPNPKTAAADPYPENLDNHTDCDNGSITLSWTGGGIAVKHRVLFGTSSNDLKLVAETTSTKYTTKEPLSDLEKYFWRVDEVDKDGNVYEGDVWSFRARHLAFPGAEGYGKYAIGGRGGVVYHVTSLDDDVDDPQPGTFRYGIKNVSGARTIVFDVSGYITLKGRLTCSDKYVTVAGQTAPGEGITFRGAPLGFATDGITRFIRSYRGYAGTVDGPVESEQNKGIDGIGMAGNDNSIVDHCSISWTTDEGFSSRGARSITLQHTLISEALNCADHPNYESGKYHGFAATIGGGQGSGVGSFHHNLLAHNEGRNWSISGGLTGGGAYDGAHDIFNNVVYNWGGRATDGGSHEINFVNNYYKKGPSTTQTYLLNLQLEGTGTGSQSAYVSGNIRQEVNNGTKTQDALNSTYKYTLSGNQVLSWTPFVSSPFFESEANIETADAAYANVLSDVGCNQPFFNSHDARMISETYNGTYSKTGSKTGKKGLIDREWDSEGYVDIPLVTRAADFDTDQDGMPDWWENLHEGLNPLEADNNDDSDADGYTALEDYINWLAVPHFDVPVNGKVDINLHDYFAGYPTTAEYTMSSDNGSIAEAKIENGTMTVAGKSEAGIDSVSVTATSGSVSLTRTFNIHVDDSVTGIYSIYSDAHVKDNHVYNIAGQQVNDAFKGIVVKNGHKYIK